MSVSEAVEAAIQADYASNIEAALSLPTLYEGAWDSRPSEVAHAELTVQELPGREASVLIASGSARPRTQWLQIVTVFAPANVGKAAGRAICDAIANHYDRRVLTGIAGVDRLKFRHGDIIPLGFQARKGRYEFTVTHPFRTDQTT